MDYINLKNESIPVDAPQRRRLPILLRRAWYNINRAFRRSISHVDLTPDQFTILRWLNEGAHRGLSQRELADLMSSDPNTIASLLGRMETMGLISRTAHETDKRAHRIRIQPAGSKRYRQVRPIAVDIQQRALSVLPDHERAAFLEQLEKVADACHDVFSEASLSKTREP